MRGKYFLLGYLLVKVIALVCKADGEPGQLDGFVMMTTSNGSREDEGAGFSEPPHTEDRCRGYYDVMGQWDPPFVCKTGDYLYCCGTCGFRFCCSYKTSRLDQSTCKNYDTPVWMMTGQTPFKKNDLRHDPTKDKTNLIVYIICGVVAIMALVGIFTKLGLEKAHRPQRENMARAVQSVLQVGCPGEQFQGEDTLGMQAQHYDTRANNLQGGQINNTVGQPHPYPALSQLAHVYEQQQPGKELNKYASLKLVAAKANGDFYNKRRLMVELPSEGGLPLHPLGSLGPEPVATYITEMPTAPKQNAQKPQRLSSKQQHHPLAYSSNTIAAPRGMGGGVGLKGWDGTETVGRRKGYGSKRPQCTVEQINKLHSQSRSQSHSQHFLPTQPYFVTNSKTEVTV
uniref:protein shisa-9A-like n=1 Tax=Oncorhynchus gorbuscha TaxID=8017 RepID=UPI001EAEC9C7|nr:protein shisa-9A-like [Oncorhynchus gorbuscha]